MAESGDEIMPKSTPCNVSRTRTTLQTQADTHTDEMDSTRQYHVEPTECTRLITHHRTQGVQVVAGKNRCPAAGAAAAPTPAPGTAALGLGDALAMGEPGGGRDAAAAAAAMGGRATAEGDDKPPAGRGRAGTPAPTLRAGVPGVDGFMDVGKQRGCRTNEGSVHSNYLRCIVSETRTTENKTARRRKKMPMTQKRGKICGSAKRDNVPIAPATVAGQCDSINTVM